MILSDEEWDVADCNQRLFLAETVTRLSEWVAIYYSRQAHFPRLVTQQGLFTFASKPNLDHWESIKRTLDPKHWFSVAIKADAKVDILRNLDRVGLNGATLFPGADGIGRSMEGFARAGVRWLSDHTV